MRGGWNHESRPQEALRRDGALAVESEMAWGVPSGAAEAEADPEYGGTSVTPGCLRASVTLRCSDAESF